MARAKSLGWSLSVKLAAAGFAVLLLSVLAGPALAATNGNSGLQLNKTASPDPVTVGKNLTFTITDTNTNSSGTLFNVFITDNLPSGVNFDSVAATGPGGTAVGCSSQGGALMCGPFTLGPGEAATVTIGVTPTVKGRITNTATDDFGNSEDATVTIKDSSTNKKRHHHRHRRHH